MELIPEPEPPQAVSAHIPISTSIRRIRNTALFMALLLEFDPHVTPWRADFPTQECGCQLSPADDIDIKFLRLRRDRGHVEYSDRRLRGGGARRAVAHRVIDAGIFQ